MSSSHFVMDKIKLTTMLVIVVFLAACSKKSELNEILPQVLGYTPVEPYTVVDHERSPKFLDAWGFYRESVNVVFSESDHKQLVATANSHWKIQPRSRTDYISWERITTVDEFGVIAVSAFSSESNIVYIHLSN